MAGYVAVDHGALTMALNVLRRAGKDEVAQALAETVKPLDALVIRDAPPSTLRLVKGKGA
jgi:hypothetical protein